MRLGNDDASLFTTSAGFEPWFAGVQNKHLSHLSTTSSVMLKETSGWYPTPLVSLLLLFVIPNRHHLVGVLGQQPLTSTVPVHRCDWQAPQVLPGVILRPVPEPPY